MSSRWPLVVVTMVCFGIGLVIAAQWRTRSQATKSRVMVTSVEQAVMLSNLVESNTRLRNEITSLDEQLRAFQRDERQSTLQKLVDELARLRIVNGLVETSGPGLEIKLTGEIAVYDVQDVINELRNAGAEAIALNEQRLVLMSIIEEQGRRVTVDGVTLTSPYQFQAVGDADTLLQAVTRKGGIIDLLKSTYPALDVSIKDRQELVLPIYRRPYQFEYATVVR
jgi:uncharacterized protein YlxW (UPF0749 family)